MSTAKEVTYKLLKDVNHNTSEYVVMGNNSHDWLESLGHPSLDMEVLKEDEDYYDYDYDYDASVSTLPVGELVAVALVYGTTLLLGVLGNALVIFSILRYRRMQTVTNIFLTSLASADLMLVLLCVPIKVRSFCIWCSK